jgi:hypothetical protein
VSGAGGAGLLHVEKGGGWPLRRGVRGWRGGVGPGGRGVDSEYLHEAVEHDANEYVRGNVHTNGIESFWSLLKRSIKGTCVSVDPFHLFRYLDEQAFRFNSGGGGDSNRFRKVTETANGKRLTYKELIGQNAAGNYLLS